MSDGTLLETYLNDQRANVNDVGIHSGGDANVNSGALVSHAAAGGSREVRPVDVPTNEVLDEFKNRVRNWMDVDNNIKKLKTVMKEQMALKRQLTQQVLEFMSKYNIEDLNTKDGKLRYKVSVTKAPVTRATIRARMMEMYGKAPSVQELLDYVFSTEEKIEKPILRRLKNTRETRLD